MRLLTALLAGLLLFMPAFAWGDSWGKSPALEAQTTSGVLDKETAEEWYNKGIELYSNGKYEDAIQAFDEAIKINPQIAAGAWSNKGNALASLGKYDDAIKAYDKAISINHLDAKAWYNKGGVLYRQGKYDEAIKAYDQAININPENTKAWSNKGAALNLLGKYGEAIEALDQAISIDPQYAKAWFNKGNALDSQGKYDEAIKAYDQAIDINPQDSDDCWIGKAVALSALNRTAEADLAFAKFRELAVGNKNVDKAIDATEGYQDQERME